MADQTDKKRLPHSAGRDAKQICVAQTIIAICQHGIHIGEDCDQCRQILAKDSLMDRYMTLKAKTVKSEFALRAAKIVLQYDVNACNHCNYGKGATGSSSDGTPCEECALPREALKLVEDALK